MLFVLVLTMISGARELMTPGAWEKQGLTYRLAQKPASAPEALQFQERRDKLLRLQKALWAYAGTHNGQFPLDRSAPEIARDLSRGRIGLAH